MTKGDGLKGRIPPYSWAPTSTAAAIEVNIRRGMYNLAACKIGHEK